MTDPTCAALSQPEPDVMARRVYINNPVQIAECGGPCWEGGPEACDCGALWRDQPEPAGLSDEELMELMPQQFRDDLATVSRMAAHGAGPDVGAGLFLASLNTGALEFARTAIAADREPDVDDILPLAAIIRKVDGNNSLGAAALAEEILSHPHSRWTADRAQRQPLPTHDLSNVAPLLWVLWNHLGARSPVGQPIREYLGMGQFQPMTDAQMAAANQYRALLWNSPQPEPAGQIPPDYIDPEHTGPDRELLQAFYAACQSEGGTADEVTLRGLRAAIAADRAQRQPVPPADGEVQELVKWLQEQEGWMGARAMYSRIAELLAQRYPQPVPGEVQELVRVLHQAADNDEWDGASPEWCASLTRAAELLEQRQPVPPEPGEVQELVGLIRQIALAWEPDATLLGNMTAGQLARTADLLAQRHPQPVPVSERLPDNRDPECVANWPECWSGGYDPRCCRFPKSCSCERGALPLPGEVEG